MTARHYFEVVEAKAWHCGLMARKIRSHHATMIEEAGANAHRELRACFDQSAFRRSWLIDGKVEGIGGVIGGVLNPTGMIWLALSNEATRYPIAIVKEARRQLDDLMQVKKEVMTTIVFGDDAARRLAVFLGFHVAHDGVGDRAWSRAGRKALSEVMEKYDERIVSVGKIRAVLMGYHYEEA